MRQRAGFLSKIIPAKTGSKNLRLKQTSGHDPLVFHGASRAEDLNRQMGKPFHFSYSLLTKIDSICAQISSISLKKGFPGKKPPRRDPAAEVALPEIVYRGQGSTLDAAAAIKWRPYFLTI